jgi:adenylate cyclase
MASEIERKFLTASDDWRAEVRASTRIRQGYFISDGTRSVRVRTMNDHAVLTIKSGARIVDGASSRAEFEYAVPFEDAAYMLDHLCHTPLVDKIRHEVEYAGMLWEVDEFLGANDGLIMAEIEVDDAAHIVHLPPWIGPEVTSDKRYFNSYIAAHPGFWKTTADDR